MKKINLILLVFILTICSNLSFGQSSIKTDSIVFCGKHFIAPHDCETIGNMIKCSNYVFTWINEPIADLPRHQKELLAQTKNPKKISVSVVDSDNVGYITKMGTSYQLLIIGIVNGQGVIINLWLDKPIKSTDDLPEYIRQFITIKS